MRRFTLRPSLSIRLPVHVDLTWLDRFAISIICKMDDGDVSEGNQVLLQERYRITSYFYWLSFSQCFYREEKFARHSLKRKPSKTNLLEIATIFFSRIWLAHSSWKGTWNKELEGTETRMKNHRNGFSDSNIPRVRAIDASNRTVNRSDWCVRERGGREESKRNEILSNGSNETE